MKITKLGHCCLLVEEGGLRIMTDPGIFTVGQHELVENLDIILFTHEHPDHYHLDSLKLILKKNPNARIITNTAVGKLLDVAGIKYEILEHGNKLTVQDVLVEAFGKEHAEIYDETVQRVQNTGYMVGGRFFYPGDDLFNPEKAVEILALPVAGPWVKTKEVIDYGRLIKPKKCFPVHDGILSFTGPFHLQPQKALGLHGIEMILPGPGQVMEF